MREYAQQQIMEPKIAVSFEHRRFSPIMPATRRGDLVQ